MLLPKFCVLPALSSHLSSVFKVVYHEHPFAFLLLLVCYVSHAAVSGTYASVAVSKS